MDQTLRWSANFAVGHKKLDRQHRRLVELINDVCDTVLFQRDPRRLENLLKVLRAGTVEHIRQENALLWEISSGTYEPLQGRPRTPHFVKVMAEAAFNEHFAEHETWLARLDAVLSGAVDELCEALKAWFVDHALNHDLHLKAIFQAM